MILHHFTIFIVHISIVDHFGSLQSQHDHALQSVQDQKQLITQLESDLARVRPFLPPRTEGEVEH